jgi:hypothetical protein
MACLSALSCEDFMMPDVCPDENAALGLACSA